MTPSSVSSDSSSPRRRSAVKSAGGVPQPAGRPSDAAAAAQTDVPERRRGRGRNSREEEELHLLSDSSHHEAGKGDAH